jgi:hypothetical protein
MSLFKPVASSTGANVLNMPGSQYGMVAPTAVQVNHSYDPRQFVPITNAPPHPHSIPHTGSDVRNQYQPNYGYGASNQQPMYGPSGVRGSAPYDTYMSPNPGPPYSTNPYARQ